MQKQPIFRSTILLGVGWSCKKDDTALAKSTEKAISTFAFSGNLSIYKPFNLMKSIIHKIIIPAILFAVSFEPLAQINTSSMPNLVGTWKAVSFIRPAEVNEKGHVTKTQIIKAKPNSVITFNANNTYTSFPKKMVVTTQVIGKQPLTSFTSFGKGAYKIYTIEELIEALIKEDKEFAKLAEPIRKIAKDKAISYILFLPNASEVAMNSSNESLYMTIKEVSDKKLTFCGFPIVALVMGMPITMFDDVESLLFEFQK